MYYNTRQFLLATERGTQEAIRQHPRPRQSIVLTRVGYTAEYSSFLGLLSARLPNCQAGPTVLWFFFTGFHV